MRIAQVAPLFESVPPRLYGGTERVVSYLTEALVQQGHEVTLFATADSVTGARLVPCWPQGLREEGRSHLYLVPHMLQLEQVFRRCDEFDVVHFHTDHLHFPLLRRHAVPALTTLHGRLDIEDLQPLMREFGEMRLASISQAQRAPLSWARWVTTVHHGLPRDLLHLHEQPGRYLAFLGRICAEKRVDRAIEIAKRLQLPLRIAAKVDPADKAYYEAVAKPLMDHPLVEYVGEIGEREKDEFLGNAMALLFPIDWPEPFGLVMIEAMACGTPVVAWRNGSVPEIVEPGLTGFIVDGIEEAAQAVAQALRLDRRRCRARFEQRFTAERMARDYLSAYELLAQPAASSNLRELSHG